MNADRIIQQLEDERDRLSAAINALTNSEMRRRRRPLSAAAKKRISEGMKKRWAEKKK